MHGMLHRGKSFIALEMIAFQNNSFGIDLEKIISELKEKIAQGKYSSNAAILKSEEVDSLQTVVFSRLKLKIKLITNGPLAAVMPFYSNKNHVFLDEYFRGNFTLKDQEKLLRESNNQRGTVNREKAVVGGLFSKYENKVYMNFKELFGTFKMTAPEVVAIFLHELGHAFYACEYSDRMETNNQVLVNVANEISKNKEKADQVYVYRELQTVNKKVTQEQVDVLLNGNRVIAGTTWFQVVIGTVEQQMANNKYDETSFEQLADNFASRFGYGRALVSSLDKLYLRTGSPEKTQWIMRLSQTMDTSYLAMILSITIGSIYTLNIPYAIIFSLLTWTVLYSSGESAKSYTYDELKIRYKRIRQESIEMIKTLDLDKTELKELLDSIYYLDKIINETHRYNSVTQMLSNFLFKGHRVAKSSIEEQQLLEELSFSDLFLKSAQLKSIF